AGQVIAGSECDVAFRRMAGAAGRGQPGDSRLRVVGRIANDDRWRIVDSLQGPVDAFPVRGESEALGERPLIPDQDSSDLVIAPQPSHVLARSGGFEDAAAAR